MKLYFNRRALAVSAVSPWLLFEPQSHNGTKKHKEIRGGRRIAGAASAEQAGLPFPSQLNLPA
jgi:hypothetical protein